MTIENERESIKQLQQQLEIKTTKINFLESSLKGALKENTVLRVDINVLKNQLKDLNNQSTFTNQDSLELLQNRLDFKIQECEHLRKQIDDLELIQIEMEKQLQFHSSYENQIKKLENQIKSQNAIIEGLQKENENFKVELKKIFN